MALVQGPWPVARRRRGGGRNEPARSGRSV